jgi:predicted GIY-YIG superfamily endonuclease
VNDTTIATKETISYSKRMKSMMDKVPVYAGSKEDIEKKLKQHQEETYAKQQLEDEKLLDAFTKKKLKSKAAIKRARDLVKRKRDAGKSNDKAVNPQDNITVEGQ